MSKIVFHNPHVIWLKDTVPSYFSRTRSVGKYDYLFDYVYKHNQQLTVLVNNAGSEPVFKGFMRFLNKPFIEFYAWLLLNRLNPFKIDVKDNDEVFVNIHRLQSLVDCENLFFDYLKKNGLDTDKVKLLRSIIWLNMSPLHHHPFDFFLYYYGKYSLFNQLNDMENEGH